MKAILLAAGMGTRLGKYTKDLPKCMLEFNGKPLIQWQVDTLRAAGIKEIIVVKGYEPDKISIPDVKYYENKDFAHTNMVETLFSAEPELTGDILVCYADILYEKKIIEKIIGSKEDIGVTVDTDYWDYWKSRLDNPEDDTESLVIKEDKIVELGDTNCTPDKAKVRYVGLIKFSAKGTKILKKEYKKNKEQYYTSDRPWLRSKSFKKAYMTCMLQAIINEGRTITPIRIKRGWLEFDTEDDYVKYSNWLEKGTLKRFFSFENI